LVQHYIQNKTQSPTLVKGQVKYESIAVCTKYCGTHTPSNIL